MGGEKGNKVLRIVGFGKDTTVALEVVRTVGYVTRL